MKRRNFSNAIIKARLEHAGYRCEGKREDGTRCMARADPGRFQCDHVIPDQLGGEPTLDNAQILCTACHAIKTAGDVADIAKAKRREADHLGITKAIGPDKAIQGAPMPTTRKAAARAQRGHKPPVTRKRELYA